MVPQPSDQPKGKKVVNSDTDHYLYHRNNISFTISIRSTHITSSFFYMCPSFQTRKKSIKHTQIHSFEKKIPTYLTFIRAQIFKILPLLFISDFSSQHRASKVKQSTAHYNNRSTHRAFSFLQFPAITVSGPANGTICWHRGRPKVQCYNNAPTKP